MASHMLCCHLCLGLARNFALSQECQWWWVCGDCFSGSGHLLLPGQISGEHVPSLACAIIWIAGLMKKSAVWSGLGVVLCLVDGAGESWHVGVAIKNSCINTWKHASDASYPLGVNDWWDMIEIGVVFIHSAIPLLNSWICSLMYMRKAWNCHPPASIMGQASCPGRTSRTIMTAPATWMGSDAGCLVAKLVRANERECSLESCDHINIVIAKKDQ